MTDDELAAIAVSGTVKMPPRLKPGAKRVVMNTRWHEEDVAGRILEQIAAGTIKAKVISSTSSDQIAISA